jgi:hypothetical protein
MAVMLLTAVGPVQERYRIALGPVPPARIPYLHNVQLRLVRHVSLSVPDERYVRPPNLYLFWALKCLKPTLGSVLGEGYRREP